MLYEALHTLVFAQVIGIYLVIMAVVMVARAPYFRKLMASLTSDNPVIVVSAGFSLLLGLFLVILHNDWAVKPGILVTLVGWCVVIKSVLWLSMPERMLCCAKWFYASKWYFLAAFLTALLGAVVLSCAYYPYMPNPLVILQAN